MWRKATPLAAYYESIFAATQTGSKPVALESFTASLSGGSLPQPGDVVLQGLPNRYVSGGTILLICDIPAGTRSFDTLVFYDALGTPLATCPYPSDEAAEGFTIYAYLAFASK